jgi:hypothetical protein
MEALTIPLMILIWSAVGFLGLFGWIAALSLKTSWKDWQAGLLSFAAITFTAALQLFAIMQVLGLSLSDLKPYL